MQVETQASVDLKALVVEMIGLSLFMLLRERGCVTYGMLYRKERVMD